MALICTVSISGGGCVRGIGKLPTTGESASLGRAPLKQWVMAGPNRPGYWTALGGHWAWHEGVRRFTQKVLL
jgi:hypothetical protein